MLGEFVEAREAERIGLYNRVVAGDRVLAEARAWAERLARGPSVGLANTKEMLDREATMTLAEALEAEARAQAACMREPTFREGYDAFKAKRPPRFA